MKKSENKGKKEGLKIKKCNFTKNKKKQDRKISIKEYSRLRIKLPERENLILNKSFYRR